MKAISDKLKNYTDRYSFLKKRKSLNEDQNVQRCSSCIREIGIKNVKLLNLGHDQIFWLKENQSILVVNNYFSSKILIYLRG